jgi:hypothetical protein
MTKPAGHVAFQLHIELDGVSPVVWRRLLVPSSVRLSKLSDMLLVAMGWTNSHLHCFNIGGASYGMQFDDYPEDEIDEKSVTVLQALRDTRELNYQYDFGDSWDHLVTVEAEFSGPLGLRAAVCLGGENACPPEDCGGSGGYRYMLEALADPKHEEHEDYLSWVGGPFDPTSFDLVTTNAALQKV